MTTIPTGASDPDEVPVDVSVAVHKPEPGEGQGEDAEGERCAIAGHPCTTFTSPRSTFTRDVQGGGAGAEPPGTSVAPERSTPSSADRRSTLNSPL